MHDIFMTFSEHTEKQLKVLGYKIMLLSFFKRVYSSSDITSETTLVYASTLVENFVSEKNISL